jgi:hypothetical protein
MRNRLDLPVQVQLNLVVLAEIHLQFSLKSICTTILSSKFCTSSYLRLLVANIELLRNQFTDDTFEFLLQGADTPSSIQCTNIVSHSYPSSSPARLASFCYLVEKIGLSWQKYIWQKCFICIKNDWNRYFSPEFTRRS